MKYIGMKKRCLWVIILVEYQDLGICNIEVIMYYYYNNKLCLYVCYSNIWWVNYWYARIIQKFLSSTASHRKRGRIFEKNSSVVEKLHELSNVGCVSLFINDYFYYFITFLGFWVKYFQIIPCWESKCEQDRGSTTFLESLISDMNIH